MTLPSEARSERNPSSGEWRSWAELVHARARRHAGSREDAEDLAQETLAYLADPRHRVDRPGAWLKVVIRRAVAAGLRFARNRPDRVALEDAGEPVAPEESPLLRLALREALEALPERQSKLLRLRAAGLSHREIAARIGCEVHQVGPRLDRAQGALRRRLESTLHGIDEAPPRAKV